MKEKISHITTKLKAARRAETIHFASRGIFLILAIASVLIFIISLIEALASGDSLFRTTLFYVSTLIILSAGIYFLWPVILRIFSSKHKPDTNTIAKRVGQVYPEINDRLSNTIQLVTAELNRQNTSDELAESAFNQIYDSSKDIDFKKIINKKGTIRAAIFFLISSVLIIGLFITFSNSLTSALFRIFDFDQEYIPPAPFSLTISPCDVNVIKGSQVTITVSARGKTPDYVELHFRELHQKNEEVLTLKPDSLGNFNYTIISPKNSIEYFAQAPWMNTFVKTSVCSLNVITQPIIKAFTGRVNYPVYTKLSPSEINEQSGDISTLKGSFVNFRLISSKNLSSANIVFIQNDRNDSSLVKQDTLRLPMTVKGFIGTANLTVKSSGSYYFEIKDKNGQMNSEPVVYNLISLIDEYPTITLEEPQSNVIINDNGLMPVKVSISDDYGFSTLKLYFRLVESRFTEPDKNFSVIKIPILSGELTNVVPYLWDLNKINISPEDKYEFYLEVADNDIVSGPKTSRTNILTVRLPSLDEVLESTDEMQKKIEEDARKLLKQTEELRKETEQFNNELKQKPKGSQMDWKEKKKAEEIINQQKNIQNKISELQKDIEKMTNNLEENKAISPETLQKYLELQKLLQEVNSPELQKLQEQMQKAMQNMSKEQLEQAMKNTKFDEEQFKKSIERTTKILKRLQAEQKTDALQKRAEELLRKQEELQNKTQNSNLNNQEAKEQLAKEQEALQKDLKAIEKEIKELEKLMKELGNDMPMEELQQANEALNPDETKSEMQNAQDQISQGEQSKAGKSQNKAKSNLSKFADAMKKLKQKMQNNVSKEAIRKMQKALNDMVELSKQQEQLKQQSSNLDYQSSQIPDISGQQSQLQQSLKNITSSMMELSEKSFSFTPQMAQEIGNALEQMQNSLQQLNNRSISSSTQSMTEAMSSMNKAASQMQAMLNSMQNNNGSCDNPGGQGQGQGSGMSFSQRMQQLAQQQQGINSGMQQQMNQSGNGGQMSPEQQAEFGRIAKEQGKAKKALDDLAKEQKQMGGEKLALGDLNQISKDMNEVIADIQNGNITPETLQRQERILSRLLDANLSVNERDFEKERESKTGQQFNRKGPDELKQQIINKRQRTEDMLRSLQMGYTKDYENLIKKYFEALQNKGVNR
jgi:hypothetical protein